jgi:acyl-CoA dehydrogenase
MRSAGLGSEMDFCPNPKFDKLRTMLRFLGQQRLRPLGLEADALGHALPPDHAFFQEVLAMGLTGGFAGKMREARPDDDGRPRNTVRRAVIMAEEAAYWDRGMATSLPGPGLGGAPVLMMGTPEQKERFLAPFKQQDRPRWAAFGMTEPGTGSDVSGIQTKIRFEGEQIVVTGQKCFISNGARAEFVLVWGTVDPAMGRAGHRAVIVPTDTAGFSVLGVEHKMGLHASETATLAFDDCRVPIGNLLKPRDGSEPAGFKGAMKTFNMTRPMVAAMAIGIGRAAYDEARRFSEENFTGPSAWRAERVGDRLSRIRRKLELGRLLAWKSAWEADHHMSNTLSASMAKAACAPIALEAASLGIEILGMAGAASDRLIEKLYRDVKALDIVEGTGQIQRIIIARRLIGFTDQGEQKGDNHG